MEIGLSAHQNKKYSLALGGNENSEFELRILIGGNQSEAVQNKYRK